MDNRPPPPCPDGHVPQAIPVAAATPTLSDADDREIPEAEIDPDPDNARKHFDPDALQALADNIAANGLLKPINVYRDPQTNRFRLIGGERRWRAHQILGRKTIRARVLRQPPDPAKRSELMLIDNDQEDLDEIERGAAYLDYTTRYQCTASALAKKLGKAVSSVTRPMQLAKQLGSDIHALIRSGKLPPFAARQLVRLPDDESKRRFAALYIDRNLTAAELAAAIKNGAAAAASGPAAAASFAFQENGTKISVTLSGQDPIASVSALRQLLRALRDHGGRGLGPFKDHLEKRSIALRKAAELQSAQDALAGRCTPGRAQGPIDLPPCPGKESSS